jgi:glucokinase
MEALVGIDIGGINTKIGIVQSTGKFEVLKATSILTQSGDPADTYITRTAHAVTELIQSAGNPTILGVGVGSPGLIDPHLGLVRTSPNLPSFEGFKLKDSLSKALNLDVEIQNDANAAVLGEWLFSPASKGVRNLCLLTLGTGIGGGVVCDGHLVIGADNAAAELGHLKVVWDGGWPCGCGRTGCVEAYAGAAGITRLAQHRLGAKPNTALKPDKLTTKDINQAAAAGDQVAREILNQVGVYLGRGISLLIETFNPEKVVLAGGASAAFAFLLPGINQALDRYASFAFTRGRCKIEPSAFRDDINVIGAAATFVNAQRKATI